MSTLPPSKVREFSVSSLEKIAYTSVAKIPTRELNDQNRLGYAVWELLTQKTGTLSSVIKQSGARLLISEAEAVTMIREALRAQNVDIQ